MDRTADAPQQRYAGGAQQHGQEPPRHGRAGAHEPPPPVKRQEPQRHRIGAEEAQQLKERRGVRRVEIDRDVVLVEPDGLIVDTAEAQRKPERRDAGKRRHHRDMRRGIVRLWLLGLVVHPPRYSLLAPGPRARNRCGAPGRYFRNRVTVSSCGETGMRASPK